MGEVVHTLIVPGADGAPKRVTLGAAPVVIGRVPPADVVIGAREISRRHAEVLLLGGQAVVRDLNSTNGVWVDGQRIDADTVLTPGGGFRIGNVVIGYEAVAGTEAAAWEDDLAPAGADAAAILPAPLRDGPVLAEHFYLPSSPVGGDAFGWQECTPGVFAGYSLDVAGHGEAAAGHAATLANLLRQSGSLGADLAHPAEVVARLNAGFPTERQGGVPVSVWYWAYDTASRVLEYCSAGHHPALLLAPGGGVVVALDRNNERVGAMEGAAYTATRVRVRPGCRLYLFSEGAFAVQTADGGTWGPAEIAGLVRAAPAGGPISLEPERIYAAVRDAARPGPLADDFSVVVIGFP